MREEVKDIEARAKDEVLAQYGMLIDEYNDCFNFGEGATFVTAQNDLVFPLKLYREGENEFFSFETESGDVEVVMLYDLELDMLIKLAWEIDE